MPPALAPTFFARLTRRRPRAARQQEAADMGTAFGMEQWLDERDHQSPPVSGVRRAQRSWWPRWLQGAAQR
jgi:hypothetical protein